MELCLNEQPCLSIPPFFCLHLPFLSLNRQTHTLTSSSFHLQKAVCTLNTPARSIPQGHMRKREERKHYCQMFRFRVFILHAWVRGGKRTNGSVASHIHAVCKKTPVSRKDGSSSLRLPSVSTRKCFYNCSHLALFFDFTPHPPRVCLCLSEPALWHRGVASRSPQGKSSLHRPTSRALSVTGREMNKGSKEPFLAIFSHCQVIFTLAPCGSAQCRTHQLHMTGFFIAGTWGAAPKSLLKPFHQTFSRAKQEYTDGVKCKYSSTDVLKLLFS